jgi:hypothetical protein
MVTIVLVTAPQTTEPALHEAHNVICIHKTCDYVLIDKHLHQGGIESPFLHYVRCNRGATGIEIIDNRDTIDTFSPQK